MAELFLEVSNDSGYNVLDGVGLVRTVARRSRFELQVDMDHKPFGFVGRPIRRAHPVGRAQGCNGARWGTGNTREVVNAPVTSTRQLSYE